jgi:predicted KAP-like P-loop ATPase
LTYFNKLARLQAVSAIFYLTNYINGVVASMKIHPPILDIPPNNPYVNDLFGRKAFAESLLLLIKNVDDGIVLCIDAPWGDGKTSFAQMWIADLQQRGIKCIYYDAYEHDYCDDPFISFSAEIISLAETNFSGNKEVQKLKEDFKSKAKRIGSKFITVGARIGAKALTLGVIENSDIDALKNIKEDLAKDASEVSSAVVGRIFDNYTATKNQVDEFKEKLSNLGQAVKTSQGFPLLIIIDELDRCRPDFALALLERIKHLYMTDCMSFILLVNMKQLENYVKTIYGNSIDARNYLHKFITLSTILPKNKSNQYDNDYTKYLHRLMIYHEIDKIPNIEHFIVDFFKDYQFSLREMEQCITILTVYYTQLPKNSFHVTHIICFLAVLRIRFPQIFSALETGMLSYKELSDKTNVEKITYSDKESTKFYFLGLLKYLLLTDEEYKTLDEDEGRRGYDQMFGNVLFLRGISRKEIIPLFCSELLKFRKEN